jgi:putative tricarboxylic transport membrane protein
MILDFGKLYEGFLLIANGWTPLGAFLGLAAGMLVGAVPGVTATMAVAILSPFTFFMNPIVGIPFLLGVFKGIITSGSIPAILINTPGNASAAATGLDGFMLTRKGEARRALEMSLYASVVADMLGTVVLIFVAEPLASVALKFGPPEFTLLFAFAMTMVATLSGTSIPKGLIAAALGILLACIGLDPMSGYERFTFGSIELTGGISLVPLLIGVFALSEVLIQSEQRLANYILPETRGRRVTLADMRRVAWTIVRSTGLGVWIGILPGMGAETACWIAYGAAKQRSKHPEEFGKGSIEGLAAAEAGNNASVPTDLIQMIVFGIPGDTVTAILLGAFMAQGIHPGPLMFVKHSEILYAMFASLLLTNVLLLGFGYIMIRYFVRIVLIPRALLLPSVMVICFAGSFAINNSFFDIIVAVTGGIVGYLMRKAELPVPPLVIAALLTPGFESSLRRSLVMSDGSLSIFFTRPIAAVMSTALIAGLAYYLWKAGQKRFAKKPTLVKTQ